MNMRIAENTTIPVSLLVLFPALFHSLSLSLCCAFVLWKRGREGGREGVGDKKIRRATTRKKEVDMQMAERREKREGKQENVPPEKSPSKKTLLFCTGIVVCLVLLRLKKTSNNILQELNRNCK
mmetsp:Transcript_43316/g.112620  ORF Transcript_43316/g.112620 Transcript_43316/m.112620 type:complete len:124 (+) Transcript_43316:72-443(+)